METFVYLKERNTYGLLCGVNKDEAKQKYPDLVNDYQNDQEVLGYEPYDFFLKRVKELIKKLKYRSEKTLICVTHGKLLKALFKEILGIEAKKFHDNCIAEIDIDKQGNLNLVTTDGIEI
ncbi:histidine phosphatase family protein [Patescibacteria group bacterium]|nr:histidine phosphatase family protein [Patescibacteria group bacterium]